MPSSSSQAGPAMHNCSTRCSSTHWSTSLPEPAHGPGWNVPAWARTAEYTSSRSNGTYGLVGLQAGRAGQAVTIRSFAQVGN